MSALGRRLRDGAAEGLLAVALLSLVAYSLANALPRPALMDYGSFFASGEAASKGLNPYDIYPLTFHVVVPGFESWNQNLNPPISLPLFELLSRMDPHRGFRLWWAVSAVAYGVVAMLLARHAPGNAGVVRILWLLALAGFWNTLTLGQIYIPLVLASVGGWILLDRGRPVASGLLIGLVVAVKPNFLVWPVILLLAGHARPAIAAGVSAAILTALPAAIYGPDIYLRWAEAVLDDPGRPRFLTNVAFSGLAHRLGLPELGLPISGALLVALAFWAWRKHPSPLAASAAALTGAVLASPIAWVHYTLFLLPVILWLASAPAIRLAAAMLLVPVPVVLDMSDSPWWIQATAGSVYAWAVALIMAAVLTTYRAMPEPASHGSR